MNRKFLQKQDPFSNNKSPWYFSPLASIFYSYITHMSSKEEDVRSLHLRHSDKKNCKICGMQIANSKLCGSGHH